MSTLRNLLADVNINNLPDITFGDIDYGYLKLHDKSSLVYGIHDTTHNPFGPSDSSVYTIIRFMNGKVNPDSPMEFSCTCDEYAESNGKKACAELSSLIQYIWKEDWFDSEGVMLQSEKLEEDYSKDVMY